MPQISDEAVKHMVSALPNLELLETTGCPNVEDKNVIHSIRKLLLSRGGSYTCKCCVPAMKDYILDYPE